MNWFQFLCLAYFAPGLIVIMFDVYGQTCQDVQMDLERRANSSYYVPTLTVGTIVKRFLFALLPILNFGRALYWFFHGAFNLIELIAKTLTMPVVPKK
jgi:hypothetical protein